MCCLNGIAGTLEIKYRSMFENLLIVGQVRGVDSTGLATIDRNSQEVSLFKKAINAMDFLEMPRFSKMNTYSNSIMIGHNRKATIGSTTTLNAHPFEFSSLVGTHNGTLSNKYTLENADLFGTDSEALYWNINMYGADAVIPKLEGAWALVWFDKKTGRLHFLRNKERELYWALSEDKKVLVWASEAVMLTFGARRCGIKLDKVRLLPEDQWKSFAIPKHNEEFDKEQVVTIPLKGKPPFTQTIWKNTYERGVNHTNFGGKAYTKPKNNNIVPLNPKTHNSDLILDTVAKDVKVKKNEPTYKGWRGEILTKDMFDKRTRHGCAFCSQSVEFGDKVRFLSTDSFLCEEHMDIESLFYPPESNGDTID